MSRIFGFRPKPETQKLIEQFENEVLIRFNTQQLLGTVYVDMQEKIWAVAFAYNYSRNPGIHGHENPLEVRYSCTASGNEGVRMYRSNGGPDQLFENTGFPDQDAFVRFALSKERSLALHAA